VAVFAYGGHAAELWWSRHADLLDGLANLSVANVPQPASRALAGLVQRSMVLDCTIDTGSAWLGDGATTVEVALEAWKTRDAVT